MAAISGNRVSSFDFPTGRDFDKYDTCIEGARLKRLKLRTAWPDWKRKIAFVNLFVHQAVGF